MYIFEVTDTFFRFFSLRIENLRLRLRVDNLLRSTKFSAFMLIIGINTAVHKIIERLQCSL